MFNSPEERPGLGANNPGWDPDMVGRDATPGGAIPSDPRGLGSKPGRGGIKRTSPKGFGTRVFVGISGDNPHQIPNPHSLLKICLVLEYLASLIPANPHFSPNFSVFFSIPNTLPLPSGL
jgi:hypothetical protein